MHTKTLADPIEQTKIDVQKKMKALGLMDLQSGKGKRLDITDAKDRVSLLRTVLAYNKLFRPDRFDVTTMDEYVLVVRK